MAEKQLEYALTKIKNSNVKATTQRVAILDYLLNSKHHPSANQIYHAIKHQLPHISMATVYNNLNTLCDNGLVWELKFGNAISRYDGDTSEHYHIICSECGEITDLHYPVLKEIETFAEQITNFKVSHHRLDLYGKCAACQ